MKYHIPSHVHYRSLNGDIIMLDGKHDRYLGLNGTGAVVWGVLAEGGSHDDAARALSSRFGIGSGRASEDVSRLITKLVASGLLKAGSE